MVTMAAGQNMAYGSCMSPPRLQQIQEACAEHFSLYTSETDPLFQLWGHEICKALQVDSTQPDVMAQVYEGLKTHDLLTKKGERVCCSMACACRIARESHLFGEVRFLLGSVLWPPVGSDRFNS